MNRRGATTRRKFLERSAALAAASVAAAGAGLLGSGCRTVPSRRVFAPGEKMRLGVVGVANRGRENLDGVKGEEIVALCDVDERFLDSASAAFPGARRYVDFREMLSVEKDLDGVVVSTADHTHAVATAMALRRGCHVYCEKPLTHTVEEARIVTELAADLGAVTQLGTQIHSWPNYRRVVELVRSGAIGPVREVHAFCDKTWSGGDRPTATPPVPKGLHYDLWLGPADERPYHPDYLPASWRRWWTFGGGTLADMACHYVDLAYWALGLSHPLTVKAEGPPVHPETTPPWLVVRYEYPGGLQLAWYDGGRRPERLAEFGLEAWRNGVLFVGERGWIVADYENRRIGPDGDFAGFTPPPPSIPDSIGHYEEWIRACKSGGETTCPFSYSGPLTEAVLLGNVAYRTGKKLEWDARRLRARNLPEADRLVRAAYRRGWEVS